MKKYTVRFAIFFILLCGSLFCTPSAHAQQFSYNVSAAPGANPGQVTVTWTQIKQDVKNYNILFGPENNKSQFGAVNIDGNVPVGKSVSYTVNYLTSNTNYFFTLVPVANGKAVPLNFQVASLPKPGSSVVPPSTLVSPSATSTGPAPNTALINIDDIKNQKGDIKSKNIGLHALTVERGDKPGEVKLNWKHLDGETNYHVVYGNKKGELKYGALNVGNTTFFTVKALKPGEIYYFAIAPVVNGRAQYITQQASQPSALAPQSNNSNSGGSGGQNSGGSSGTSGGSSSTTTNTNTTNTTTGGTSGGSSTTTTTTTTTTKDNNTKNNDTNGQGKKVKGVETQVSNPTIWELLKKLFGL